MNNNLNTILAKSINYGNISLLEHTQHVVSAIEFFADRLNFDIELAKKAATLHDLGKAHPHFQRKISKINMKQGLMESRKYNYNHRHEISSLAFLSCFPKNEWDTIIEMVIAHHKSIENDPNEKGILDIYQNERKWIDNHLEDWENWSEYGYLILENFNYKFKKINKDEAKENLNYVYQYCENIGNGWSKYRGLLMSADHFASAFMDKTNSLLNQLFELPKLDYYFNKKRENNLYPLSKQNTITDKNHTLLIAPTGAGKTDFLIKRCKSRIFYVLPYQASINAMYLRLKATIPNKDIRVLHATSKIVAGKQNVDEQVLQPLIGSCVKILTPHQLAAIIFGTKGFESLMIDIKGCDVILDEIHTYSDFTKAMVLEIVRTLLSLNCNVHIGSATIPTNLYQELIKILGGENKVYEVKLNNEILKTFTRHQIFKLKKTDDINFILENAFSNKQKVLLIYNTVKKAQNAYKELKEIFENIPIMLLHSRFRRKDRVILEKKLMKEFNGEYTDNINQGFCPCLVISTQVVEVSLDISFDLMITECAPLDSLIQRLGRINRIRNDNTIGKYKPIYIIEPNGNLLPYTKEIVEKSFNELPENGNLINEEDIQNKIDIVFNTIDTKQIDIHLIFQEENCILKKLTNNKEAILLNLLEIETATCILENDRELYFNSNNDERTELEIPINWKTISRFKKEYEQLQIGSYPFVVPQNINEYNNYGLELIEHDKFL